MAIETPTYFGLLEVLESLDLRALEVATFPEHGICLDALEEALRRHRVAAACSARPSATRSAPACRTRRRAARGAARRAGVPLVEDDVYGDLTFEHRRPPPVKAFDTHGSVLLCSSFSKTLAPGLRVGWAAPGRYRRAVESLKFNSMLAVPTPTQMRSQASSRRAATTATCAGCAAPAPIWWRAPATRCRARSPLVAREPAARRLRAVGRAACRIRRAASLRAGARRAASRSRPARSLRHRALPDCFRLAASTPWTPAVERALERWASWSASRCRLGAVAYAQRTGSRRRARSARVVLRVEVLIRLFDAAQNIQIAMTFDAATIISA